MAEINCSACQEPIPSNPLEWIDEIKLRVCGSCLNDLAKGNECGETTTGKNSAGKCPRCDKTVTLNSSFEWNNRVKMTVCESCFEKLAHTKKWNTQYPVKFVKKMREHFKSNCQYRGFGQVRFSEEGVIFGGRHLQSENARILVGFLLFFTGVGILLIYFILEYIWLKHEEMFVPFSDINSFSSNAEKRIVGIGFKNPLSPVFCKVDEFESLLELFNEKLSQKTENLKKLFEINEACPKCGWNVTENDRRKNECPKCGIIFSKYFALLDKKQYAL